MAEPTLADILARLDRLEQRIAEIAAHEQAHHHAPGEPEHEHAPDHDHEHEGHGHRHRHGHRHGHHEGHGEDCHHDHLAGCPCGFDERRVVDLIVDLVEQRMRRLLASGPGAPFAHGHDHGPRGHGGCRHCGR